MTWKTTAPSMGGTVYVRHTASDADGAFFNGYVKEMLVELSAIVDQIPEEYRDKAEIEFESDYESTIVKCEISYQRPATAQEIDAANNAKGQAENQIRQREIETLRKLKARYPDVN